MGATAVPAQTPIITQTNSTVRILAANLSSGNFQRYEAAGLRILKGLRPDIVAIQEFNYASTAGAGINTPAAFREMVDTTFGTNFTYFRESSATENYTIPNGIISRFPVLSSGTWDDTLIPDRGYAWARIDIPGTNDLYVVSVHLKSSSGSASTRASEAVNLKSLIQSLFPSNALVVLAGDFNIGSSEEAALSTFKTLLSDFPVPTDALSPFPTNTNEPRSERYDYVLASFSLTNALTAVVLPSRTFTSGLVFDSAVYNPLSDVWPVVTGDSHVSGMQHMAVVKDFIFHYSVTNYATNAPTITLHPENRTVHQAGSAVFHVIAQGTPPLAYQWRLNSSNIPSATNDYYLLTNVQPAHVGMYSLRVTNSGGAATSSNALLSLIVPQPTLTLGSGQVLEWQGLSNLAYRVQWKSNLDQAEWITAGLVTSPTLQLKFTNGAPGGQRFYRVIYP